jgi:hypothetical protein
MHIWDTSAGSTRIWEGPDAWWADAESRPQAMASWLCAGVQQGFSLEFRSWQKAESMASKHEWYHVLFVIDSQEGNRSRCNCFLCCVCFSRWFWFDFSFTISVLTILVEMRLSCFDLYYHSLALSFSDFFLENIVFFIVVVLVLWHFLYWSFSYCLGGVSLGLLYYACSATLRCCLCILGSGWRFPYSYGSIIFFSGLLSFPLVGHVGLDLDALGFCFGSWWLLILDGWLYSLWFCYLYLAYFLFSVLALRFLGLNFVVWIEHWLVSFWFGSLFCGITRSPRYY